MSKPSILKAIKKYFTPTYVVVVVAFLCWFFYTSRESLLLYLQKFSGGYLLLSALCLFGFYIFQCLAFIQIQSNNALIKPSSIAPAKWFYGYMYGLMGHYIPGKIPVVLGRIVALAPFGISKQAAILCVFYETFIAVAISFALSAPLLFITNIAGEEMHYMQLILAILCLLAILAFIFTPFFKSCVFWVLRILKTTLPDKNVFLTKITLVKTTGHYIISYFFSMLAFFSFCQSISPVSINPGNIYIIGTSMVFSGAVGLIALFAPSGLGVREAGIVFFISVATNLVPLDVALLIAVCFRVLTAVIEILLFGLVLFIYKLHKSQPNRSN